MDPNMFDKNYESCVECEIVIYSKGFSVYYRFCDGDPILFPKKKELARHQFSLSDWKIKPKFLYYFYDADDLFRTPISPIFIYETSIMRWVRKNKHLQDKISINTCVWDQKIDFQNGKIK